MNKVIFPVEISDVHTHRRDAGPEAIINLAPGEPMLPGHHYSVGIHPWDAAAVTPERLAAVEQAATLPAVIAIGEAGIDTIHQPAASLERQIELLRWHIAISERLGKPLILHAVGNALQHIVALRRELRPHQPWIWHGFRGKQQMADQLTAHGIHISINPSRPPASPVAIPSQFLHHETD